MAVRIEVEKSGSNVVLRGPEHPLLAERASAIGGRTKGRDWAFPIAKEALSANVRVIDGHPGNQAAKGFALR